MLIIINHPVGLARFPHSLFRNKVPLTYPTRNYEVPEGIAEEV
jgi:hypothetical protein